MSRFYGSGVQTPSTGIGFSEKSPGGFNRGFAMILALSVMALVTLSVGLLEQSRLRSLNTSRAALVGIQADYACFGGAVRATVNPPDSLTRYNYYGTQVEVTVSPASDSQKKLVRERAAELRNPVPIDEKSLLKITSRADSPGETSQGKSVWCFLAAQGESPFFWTAWRGVLSEN